MALFFFLSALALAYLISVFLFHKGYLLSLERNSISIALTVLACGTVSFLLVLLGIYKLLYVVYIILIFCYAIAGYLLVSKKNLRLSPLVGKDPKLKPFHKIAFWILILSSSILYFFFPTEYIKGDRDQGVYLIFGSQIQKTGSFEFSDPRYKELSPILEKAIVLGYPAIEADKSLPEIDASLSPRFYPLYPSFLAIALDLFGIEGAFRINGVFGILFLFFVFLHTKKIVGPRGAILAVFFGSLNTAQIWNLRTTLSEPLGQFLLIFAIYLAQSSFEKRAFSRMIFAGAILGVSGFNRIDSLIYLPAICFLVCYLLFVSRRYAITAISFLFGFSLLSGLGILYGYFYSRPYLIDLWERGPLSKLVFLCILSLVGTGILYAFSRSSVGTKILDLPRRFALSQRNPLRILLAAFLFGLIGFAYFVRPKLGITENISQALLFQKNSFLCFLFYVPTILVLFAVKGFDTLLFRRRYLSSLFFVFIGFFLLIVYLYEPSIHPDHFWASRRWMLFPVPFAIIMGIVGLNTFPMPTQFWKNALLVAVISSNIYNLYFHDSLIFSERMLSGYAKEYGRLGSSLPKENALYFTKRQDIASPLRYLEERETYLISNTNLFLSKATKLLETGRDIYLIEEDPNLQSPGFSFQKVEEINLSGNFPIESINRYPDMLLERSSRLQVYRIEKNTSFPKIQKDEIPVSKPSYSIRISKSTTKSRFSGWDEVIGYDKHISENAKGEYRLELSGEFLSQSAFSVVAGDKGARVLLQETAGKGDDQNRYAEFVLDEDQIDQIQIRFHRKKQSGSKLKFVTLSKIR
ncbi:glycosyltransferase family 39 protein [Leptospira semungkisensis]|uniref:glycosyltransferase family 39 protein n=1 Tax=Leptospira semungkisensis TaxID=2484985 RepID=UPI0014383147|nr:glycosyltransferase family 39 protein [Leptospira semungkisensis]